MDGLSYLLLTLLTCASAHIDLTPQYAVGGIQDNTAYIIQQVLNEAMVPLHGQALLFARGMSVQPMSTYSRLIPAMLNHRSITAFYMGTENGARLFPSVCVGRLSHEAFIACGFHKVAWFMCHKDHLLHLVCALSCVRACSNAVFE